MLELVGVHACHHPAISELQLYVPLANSQCIPAVVMAQQTARLPEQP